MDIINNIEYYFNKPSEATVRSTMNLSKHSGDKELFSGERSSKENTDIIKPITKEQLKTIIFDDSVKDSVKFCFPLNESFLFLETRELQRPITVEKLLIFIKEFYEEPLKKEIIDKAFKNSDEWKEEILEKYDGDVSKITKYDVFDNTNCYPNFCGLGLDSFEETGEYFICIGPE